MAIRLKVGDTVIVRTGAEKGKTGKITAINPTDRKVVVEGINVRTRHKKPTNALPQGGVFEEAKPFDISKVGIIHPSKKTISSRVGYKTNSKGVKQRVYKANDKEIK